MSGMMEQITNTAGRYIAATLYGVAIAIMVVGVVLVAVACGLGWLGGWVGEVER